MFKRILIILFFSLSFTNSDTIYFVYNANDDFFSVMGDFFHKSFSPQTYPCELCKLTYNAVDKKKKWKNFLNSLEHNYEFVYKNNNYEFLNKETTYPIILFGDNKNSKILISTNEINSCNNLDELIELIINRLSYANK
tara:strand:+ start:81 stop:494 length:414 start_codon:yes stop_codon:yes gene_type:complete